MSFFLHPTDRHEVIKNLYELSSNKSPDFDNIPVNVVKGVGEAIANALAHIFNLSLQLGAVPKKHESCQSYPSLQIWLC